MTVEDSHELEWFIKVPTKLTCVRSISISIVGETWKMVFTKYVSNSLKNVYKILNMINMKKMGEQTWEQVLKGFIRSVSVCILVQ